VLCARVHRLQPALAMPISSLFPGTRCARLTARLPLRTTQASFEKDKNMALIPAIRKEFDFAAVRDNLNTVATVFDDQTQLTIDRQNRA
jgi:hypothetical protein